MKLSELVTLLEEDKKRFWDIDIDWIDFNGDPYFGWDNKEGKWYVLH